MLRYVLSLVVGVTSLFNFQTASADYAQNGESAIVVNNLVSITVVNRDGSTSEYDSETSTLKQESARQQFGVEQVSYNPQTDHVQVKMSVTNDGATTEVPKSEIEDAAVASDGYGFKSDKQITINLPDVKVGSSKTFNMFEDSKASTIGVNLFSTSVVFGEGRLYQKGKEVFISDDKLFTWVNDPEHALQIDEKVVPTVTFGKTTLRNKHVLTIILTKPVYREFTNEGSITVNGAVLPWVDVSNYDNWAKAMEPYAQKYDAIINASLPAGFQADLNSIKNAGSDDQKMSAVLAAVQKRVVYFGDWRPIDGGFVPHSLADIEKMGKGDCKDMATSSVALLRRLGFDAHVAFIERGINPMVYPFPSSVVDRFNHAIVYVKTSSKALWLDPTNQQTYLGINPDIMGRPAVVIAAGGKSFGAQTPLPDASQNVFNIVEKVSVDGRTGAKVTAEAKLTGNLAEDYTTSNLGTEKAEADRAIFSIFDSPEFTSNVKIGQYQLPERISSNQDFTASYDRRDYFVETSEGLSMSLPKPQIYFSFESATPTRKSDLNVSLPVQASREIVLESVKLKGKIQQSCSYDSKWLSISRNIRQTGEGIEIWSNYVLKTNRIAATDYATPEFKTLQSKLEECFQSFDLVFTPASSSHWFWNRKSN